MIGLAAEAGFPASVLSENLLRDYVDLLVRLVEAAGALIIFVGAVLAAVGFGRAALSRTATASSSASDSGWAAT